jgi:hypothetical protein
MLRLIFQGWFLLSFSAIWIFGCSHFGSEVRNDGTASAVIPDCRSNHTTEGGLISSPIYKTWVRYDKLDLKKGFELASKILQSHGH